MDEHRGMAGLSTLNAPDVIPSCLSRLDGKYRHHYGWFRLAVMAFDDWAARDIVTGGLRHYFYVSWPAGEFLLGPAQRANAIARLGIFAASHQGFRVDFIAAESQLDMNAF